MRRSAARGDKGRRQTASSATGEGEIDTTRDTRQLMISYYPICGFTAMSLNFNDKMKILRRPEGSRSMDEGG